MFQPEEELLDAVETRVHEVTHKEIIVLKGFAIHLNSWLQSQNHLYKSSHTASVFLI